MAQRGRRGLSDSQKRDLWTRWKQGQPMSEIARAYGKSHRLWVQHRGLVTETEFNNIAPQDPRYAESGAWGTGESV